jgi:Cof subfamily protein (haloacid dehalogenase superfamily)
MLAVDMDGTLLDSNKLIPDENIDALFKLQKSGIKVVFSTGRVIESAMSYAMAIDFEADYVGSNGAKMAYEDYIENLHISTDRVIEFAYLCQEMNVDYNIITETHNYYYQNLDFYNIYYFDNEMVKNSEILSKSLFCDIKDIEADLRNEKIIKMDMYETGDDRLAKIWEKLDHNEFTIIRPEKNYVEIMNPLASKGNGVNKIAKHYGIETSQIITMGDSGNDLSMFEQSGLSIAMGNAHGDIKKLTKMTTDTNDNCGVAKALKSLQLI